MEQPVPRPGSRPGAPGGALDQPAPDRPAEQHPRRQCARRLPAAVLGVATGVVLLLTGVGLGAMTTTVVIGAGGLAEQKRQTETAPAAGPSASPPRSVSSVPQQIRAPVVARLGVEVADDRKPGARIVGVHDPGPGFSAGLARGDVLLAFGGERVDSAADLARAVARARPGDEVRLTVRRRSGGYQQLTAVLGIAT